MDHFIINARPRLYDVYPSTIILQPALSPTETNLYINVLGANFINVRNVYLSGSNPNILPNTTSYFNPFSANHLSALNPGFNASLVTNYTIENNNYIVLHAPEIFNASGFVDVLVENEAGYGVLSRDSYVPFLSTYKDAVNIQKQCILGIFVYSPDNFSQAEKILQDFQINNNIIFQEQTYS